MANKEAQSERIDWMAYVYIVWRRRWQIIVPTLAFAVLAGVVSFLLPKIWEVDAVIVPSKFLAQSESGDFREVLVVAPAQITGQIVEGSYDALIQADLDLPAADFPKIRAESLRNTNLVRVSVRDRDPQKGRQILMALFNHLKSDFDRKIEVEMSGLNTQIEETKNRILDLRNEIKTKENEIKKKQYEIRLKELEAESRLIEKVKVNKEIESEGHKLKIIEQRIIDVQAEMKTVKARIDELDRQQQKSLMEKKEATEALALLLYSNEVQQNLQYLNTLDEKTSDERLNIETLRSSIKTKEQQLLQIDNQISQIKMGGETLRAEIESIKNEIRNVENKISTETNDIKLSEDKKKRIDFTQLVKIPTPSLAPVSPHKPAIVFIAGLVMFCLSLGTALFREGLKSNRSPLG